MAAFELTGEVTEFVLFAVGIISFLLGMVVYGSIDWLLTKKVESEIEDMQRRYHDEHNKT